MNNGFVIFVVLKDSNEPKFLKFWSSGDIQYVSDAKDATVYPIYEAAETVVNTLKDKGYLCIKIFDANGNPCSN